MKISRLPSFCIAIIVAGLAYAGSAAADKTIQCADPDIGKACLECHLGGSQVCCPKGETCCIEKTNEGLVCNPSTPQPSAMSEDPGAVDALDLLFAGDSR